jgi:hypothetical protein
MINSCFAADNTTEILSINNNGTSGNLDSFEAVVSSDGRFIAFCSYADNLVPGDINYCWDVFVRDRFLNVTERVSVSTEGHEANSDSFDPAISNDGRYIVFTSYASNLIQNNNFDGHSQVFRHDRLLGLTEIVSISEMGENGDGNSYGGSISFDGCYIAFSSSASNLVDEDSNGCSDVFVRDMRLSSTEVVSISSGAVQGDHDSYWKPAISGDGRFVAFISWSGNLVDDDNDLWADIFLHDRNLKTTARVVCQYHWDEGVPFSPGLSLSFDGLYLAFISRPFLIGSITDFSDSDYFSYYKPNVFVYDALSGNTSMVSVSNTGEVGNEASFEPFISNNGRYVAFSSSSNNLVEGDENDVNDIFIRDLELGITKRVSISSSADEGNLNSFNPSISAQGNYVVFESESTNLVLGDINDNFDVFFHILNEKITIHGTVLKLVKSGDNLRIKAISNPDTAIITVLINGMNFNLTKQQDNWWVYDYTVPYLNDDVYPVKLTAFDNGGNRGTFDLNFTLDNTPPTVFGYISPIVLKSGGHLTFHLSSDLDTTTIKAYILNETYYLTKQMDGNWILTYMVPDLPDGNYQVQITAIDEAGNKDLVFRNFTVDNTSPVMMASFTPNLVKSGAVAIVRVLSDPDTAGIIAQYYGESFKLIKQSDNSWKLIFTVPWVPDGSQSIFLTAVDFADNYGYTYCSFIVDNTPPTLSGNITPEQLFSGEELKIDVNASSDTKDVNAIINGEKTRFNYQNGSWVAYYTVPLSAVPGWALVKLEAMDLVGNQAWAYSYYLVKWGMPQPDNKLDSTSQENVDSTKKEDQGQKETSGRDIPYKSSDEGLMNILGDFKSFFNQLGLGTFVTGTPPSIISNYYGPLEAIFKSPYNPLCGYFQYLEDHYRYNGIKSPVTDPIGFFSYIPQKFSEGWQKYRETGNIWDFLNYPFIHIYGYYNLEETWGGQNIIEVLYYFGGVERNGDMSLLGFLLLLTIFLPSGTGSRLVNLGKNVLTGILERVGIKSTLNLNGNLLVRQFYNVFQHSIKKYDLNPELMQDILSWATDFVNPNIFSLATKILEGVTKFTRLGSLDNVFTVFFTKLNNYQLLRGITDIANLSTLTPTERDKEIITSFSRVGELLSLNSHFVGDIVRNVSKSAVKTTVNVVKKVVTTIGKAVKKVVSIAKKTVTRTVKIVKKALSKVVSTIKQVVSDVKKTASYASNWLKRKIGLS